ncbi:MAG TPA: 4Fe-4S dicluster domain-containing protein [Frankiaceae bacterium]|nr:4Fe-4S dicluster domain-containing protein [Frankiaceae bacterium]
MPQILDVTGLQALIDELLSRGFLVVGPAVRSEAVVHAEVRNVSQLPQGVQDEQSPGRYRLKAGSGQGAEVAFFGFTSAAQSWKPYFLPARQLVLSSSREGPEPTNDSPPVDTDRRPLALLGVRACDLHAIRIQDGILAERAFTDADYVNRRSGTFVVAVTCANPGGTCFCVSMGTGPKADSGFDLRLAELTDRGRHRFLVEAGSERGAAVLGCLPASHADDDDEQAADAVVQGASQRMGRVLDTTDIRDLLYDNAEHSRWEDVADRCLSCGNCTLVCPTCFCTSFEDTTDLADTRMERERVWDSCFTGEYSHIHGGNVRSSTPARYRQWMTHKLASWIDQFGSSGCVGCGRCITWCPVGIDITEELAAIRADSGADRAHHP